MNSTTVSDLTIPILSMASSTSPLVAAVATTPPFPIAIHLSGYFSTRDRAFIRQAGAKLPELRQVIDQGTGAAHFFDHRTGVVEELPFHAIG